MTALKKYLFRKFDDTSTHIGFVGTVLMSFTFSTRFLTYSGTKTSPLKMTHMILRPRYFMYNSMIHRFHRLLIVLLNVYRISLPDTIKITYLFIDMTL